MPENRSAEWLRGAVAALEDAGETVYSRFQLAEYRALLAAAEAREAGEMTVKPDWADAMAYAISGRVSPGVLTISDGSPSAVRRLRQAAIMASEPAASDLRAGASAIEAVSAQPSAAEVIEALQDARNDLLPPAREGYFTDPERRGFAALALIARYKEASGGK